MAPSAPSSRPPSSFCPRPLLLLLTAFLFPRRAAGLNAFTAVAAAGTGGHGRAHDHPARRPQVRQGLRPAVFPRRRRGGERMLPAAAATDQAYGADQITVLEGLEPVRKRPGMYIGSTGPKGLHHLVWEVVDNAVDEAMAGHCSHVEVVLSTVQFEGGPRDLVTVRDNGRGIPTGLHPKTGKPALETVLTVLHAGGKFGGDSSGYKVSGGLHGVGVSVVNALSAAVQVSVHRDGESHAMAFAQGKPLAAMCSSPFSGPLRPAAVFAHGGAFAPASSSSSSSSSSETAATAAATGAVTGGASDDNAWDFGCRGTEVAFLPDSAIFKAAGCLDQVFDAAKLAARLDELAYLHAGLTLGLRDDRDDPTAPSAAGSAAARVGAESELFRGLKGQKRAPRLEFVHRGGLQEYLELLCRGKTPLHPDLPLIRATASRPLDPKADAGSQTIVEADVAFRWSSDSYSESVISFANGIKTGDGGSHVDGFRAVLTRTLNAIAKKTGKLKDGSPNIGGEFLREGLTAIVTVKLPEAEFEGQTKNRLGTPGVRSVVDQVVGAALAEALEWHPKALSAILDKALSASAAATAAKAARDMVRRKSLLTSTVLPGKLADCASRDASEAEIFIVEGDSAAGSAKQGRDRRTQAILPLRGKILNIEKAAPERIYQNKELQSLISALGLGVQNSEFDLSALRYHRVVIMTDADVDGAHIRLLLLTFFYRYQRMLIEGGYVYVACPPLYKVSQGSSYEEYLYSQEELDALLRSRAGESDAGGQEEGGSGGGKRAGKLAIQRFKGLGEMMPGQLWDTTMNPTTRRMRQVTVEDAGQADRLFTTLMGDSVGPRKDFITANAADLAAADLDV